MWSNAAHLPFGGDATPVGRREGPDPGRSSVYYIDKLAGVRRWQYDVMGPDLSHTTGRRFTRRGAKRAARKEIKRLQSSR